MKRVCFYTNTTLIIIFLFAIFVVNAIANPPTPEYEGVYLLTSDEQLIELKNHTGYSSSIKTSRMTADLWSGKGLSKFRYVELKQLVDIPVVSPEKVKGFYINFRKESFERLNRISLR